MLDLLKQLGVTASAEATRKPSNDFLPLPFTFSEEENLWTEWASSEAPAPDKPSEAVQKAGRRAWRWLLTFCLNFLNRGALGSMKSTSQLYPEGPPSSCQAWIIHELGNPVGFFLCQAAQKNEWCRHAAAKESEDRERVPLLAEGWTEYFNNRRLSYSGEVLWRAERLTWAEIEPTLPPPGLGGMASALPPASRRMRDLWMKPELSALHREECPDCLARAQVRADSSEWARTAAGLVSRSICNMLQAGQVLRRKGQIVGVCEGLLHLGQDHRYWAMKAQYRKNSPSALRTTTGAAVRTASQMGFGPT